MQIFSNRSDPDYIEYLENFLDVYGQGGLYETAIQLDKSLIINEKNYDRCISIDFMGYTCTTLFDQGKNVAKHCVFNKLEKLSLETEELNKKQCFIKIRILLLYPYSSTALARIQAEISSKRTALNQPKYSRGLDFLEQVTQNNFYSSSFIYTQKCTLDTFNDWINSLGVDHPLFNHPNRIELRFSSINPMLCGLRINNKFFYDVYTYAKRDKHQKRSPTDIAPLIAIDQNDGDAYYVFSDHFRYLWEHDATLYGEDVISSKEEQEKGDLFIRPPAHVRFEAKTRRISQLFKTKTPDELHRYKVQASRILNRYCPHQRPSPATEIIFLSCSWTRTTTDQNTPNTDAEQLKSLLEEHSELFLRGRLKVNLLVGIPGRNLTPQLYGALDESTIGIAVFSPDIQFDLKSQKFICRPNIYHELGYLMARLPLQRTFLFLENTVAIPSNIGDLIRIEYKINKIALKYLDLLRAFKESDILTISEMNYITEYHLNYLKGQLDSGNIGRKDFKSAESFAANYIRKKTN